MCSDSVPVPDIQHYYTLTWTKFHTALYKVTNKKSSSYKGKMHYKQYFTKSKCLKIKSFESNIIVNISRKHNVNEDREFKISQIF